MMVKFVKIGNCIIAVDSITSIQSFKGRVTIHTNATSRDGSEICLEEEDSKALLNFLANVTLDITPSEALIPLEVKDFANVVNTQLGAIKGILGGDLG